MRSGGVDDRIFEIGEILPAGSACFDHGGSAIGQGVLVGKKPTLTAAVDMEVHIDLARGDI